MTKYVIDDGSLTSKVLQYDIPVAQVIKVGPYNLNQWLVDIIEEDDEIKFVYLPFCSGDLIKPDVDIRTDIATAMHNYPKLRIILPFEQMDKPGIERKAKNYGITTTVYEYKNDTMTKKQDVDVNKLIEENKEKFHFVEYSDYGKYTVGGNDSVDVKKEKVKKDKRKYLK